jgi:hypothetical protein
MDAAAVQKIRWWALGVAVVIAVGLVLTLTRGGEEGGDPAPASGGQSSLDQLRSETRQATPYDPNTTYFDPTSTNAPTTTSPS